MSPEVSPPVYAHWLASRHAEAAERASVVLPAVSRQVQEGAWSSARPVSTVDPAQALRQEHWLQKFGNPPASKSVASAMFSDGEGGPAAVPPAAPAGCASLFKAHIATQREKVAIGGELRVPRLDHESPYFATEVGGRVVLSRNSPSERLNLGDRKASTFLESSRRADRAAKNRGGGKKAKVHEFSERSRRSMMYQSASVFWKEVLDCSVVVHATLTYPAEYASPAEAKKHFEALRERLRREYGSSLFGFWKLEPQERGAPHFHLLVALENADTWRDDTASDLAFISLREFLILSWLDVVGSSDPAHAIHHRSDPKVVQRITSYAGITRYLGKYLGKAVATAGWDHPGRFWGKINGRELKRHIYGRVREVDRSTFFSLKRLIRKHLIRAHDGKKAKAAGRVRRSAAARSDTTWNAFFPQGGDGGERSFDAAIRLLFSEFGVVSEFAGFI